MGSLTMTVSQGSTDRAPLGHGSGVEKALEGHLETRLTGLGDYLEVRMR